MLPDDIVRQAARDPDRYRERIIQQLFQLSPDGRLTEEQADIHGQRTAARNRENARQQWTIYDLDGDGTVSADEVRKLRLVMPTNERSRFETQFLQADTNADSRLSPSEINTAADTVIKRHGEDRTVTMLRSLDVDRDTVVTVDDIVAAFATFPESQAGKSQAIESAGCSLPKPTKGAHIVLLGAYEGEAVSTVAVAGLDTETSLAVFNIEPGETPVYIVATVYDAMVLKMTGAVDRVERLVGASTKVLGVSGLPKEKVTFAPRQACGLEYFHQTEDQKAIRIKAKVSAQLGRAPDQVLGAYGIEKIALPSGKGLEKKSKKGGMIIVQGNRRVQVTEDGIIDLGRTKGGRKGRAEQDLLRFYPAGIATVMPEDVVTLADTAEAYDVLPQQAGLLQLLDSGALSVLKDGAYSINQPIARFPAGLNGAHSVQFVLRRGVPMPQGSPGHSSVLIEETGKCVGGRCR